MTATDTRAAGIFMSQRRAARLLGVSQRQFRRMAEKHPLYAPCCVGLPGMLPGACIGSRTRLYHREQLRLIEAVLGGRMPIVEASLRWEIYRRRLGADGEVSSSTSKVSRVRA